MSATRTHICARNRWRRVGAIPRPGRERGVERRCCIEIVRESLERRGGGDIARGLCVRQRVVLPPLSSPERHLVSYLGVPVPDHERLIDTENPIWRRGTCSGAARVHGEGRNHHGADRQTATFTCSHTVDPLCPSSPGRVGSPEACLLIDGETASIKTSNEGTPEGHPDGVTPTRRDTARGRLSHRALGQPGPTRPCSQRRDPRPRV